MNSELILKSDLLDILFEKRNKAYGAYSLRKFYNHRLIKSITMMVAVVVAFSAFTLLPKSAATDRLDFKVTELGHLESKTKIPEVKPLIKKQPAVNPVSRMKFLSTIIMVHKDDTADILHDLKDNAAIGNNTNILLSGAATELIMAGPGGQVPGKETTAAAPVVDITTPREAADLMPQYPGGMEALRRFLMKNLRNPRDLEDGELVSVKIKFVVGYDGKLKGFEVIQDGGREFNNEVLRVLKKMPSWVPGKSGGQDVSVYYAIPVKFVREE